MSMTTYGIVEIDNDTGTWFLPMNLVERTDEELEAAIALTCNSPRPVDGGFGMRALGDIRDALEEALEVRRQGPEAIAERMEQVNAERDEARFEELFDLFNGKADWSAVNEAVDQMFDEWRQGLPEEDRALLEGLHAEPGKPRFYYEEPMTVEQLADAVGGTPEEVQAWADAKMREREAA